MCRQSTQQSNRITECIKENFHYLESSYAIEFETSSFMAVGGTYLESESGKKGV